MSAFGYWKDGTEPYPTALRRFCADTFPALDMAHLDRLIDNGEVINTGRPVQHAMTMNDVGVMKAICDTYLVRTFNKLDDKWCAERGPRAGEDNGINANERRSPLTEYWRAGNVTFRPVPVRRSQIPNPINRMPASGPSLNRISASASLPGGLLLSLGVIFTVIGAAFVRCVRR